MSSHIGLIVGLGNPGLEYAQTRHNVGFWFLDRLAACHQAPFAPEAKFFGAVGRLELASRRCWLLKPRTYMNLSGQSVAALARYYDIPVEQVLVVHDELDLPPGAVRFKQGGGHGGHNGLRDLVTHLGGGEFLRLRLGIGHPGDREAVTPYVLSRPGPADQAKIVSAVDRALEAIPDLLEGRYQDVMCWLHRKNETDE